MMFLDCFFYGAILGHEFPVNSYGPATPDALELLSRHIGHNFNHMEMVPMTRGQNPLPPDLWPGVERPR